MDPLNVEADPQRGMERRGPLQSV